MNRLGDGDTVTLNVKVPVELRDALDRLIDEEGHPNRSAAARVVLERGLAGKVAPARPKQKPRATSSGCPHPIGRAIGSGCGACGATNVR